MRVTLPPVLAIDEAHGKTTTRQVGLGGHEFDCTVANLKAGRAKIPLLRCALLDRPVLIVSSAKNLPPTGDDAITGPQKVGNTDLDLATSRWVRHPLLLSNQPIDRAQLLNQVRDSWRDAFSFIAEQPNKGVHGLREPQLGALHAIHAHWTVSEDPATIVMPTGTGKTDTMLATLLTERCNRLLVVVPTDALRSQLAEKFLTLGILKTPGSQLLSATAQHPIVCTLCHRPKTPEEARALLTAAQVTVTTSAIAGGCAPEVQEVVAELFTHLFIDEAHHAEASTWRSFKAAFRGKRVLQFTATPFRDDERPVDGRLAYNYPLRRAQERGYFRPISFRPVIEFNPKRSDVAIADAAIAQLRTDQAMGHILMARVGSIPRAKQVFPIYAKYAEFRPVELHTGISATGRRSAKNHLLSGQSRIVVCVDMLGEGFDLPELKIAAFHDVRKSLPVTLQLAGRFTRAKPGLGNATFIANTADVHVQEAIQRLYSQDPDWNSLLPDIAEKLVKEQVDLQEFLSHFTDFAPEVPLRTVEPATSCVVYRTQCQAWTPQNFRDGIPGIHDSAQVYSSISDQSRTMVVATVSRTRLKWTSAEALFGLDWQLYVLHWDSDQNLLFINGSSNAGTYGKLAAAVCGDTAKLIRGQDIFRTFSGIARLTFNSVGLTEVLGRNVRYTGRMGSDVEAGLGDLQKQRGTKSVLSGSGFAGGGRVTAGASKEGRIWCQRRSHVNEWVAWCKAAGAKLIDSSIDPNKILAGTLSTEVVLARPLFMPISVEWPEIIFCEFEEAWEVKCGETELTLAEVDLVLSQPSVDGDLTIAVASEVGVYEYRLKLSGNNPSNAEFRFEALANVSVAIRRRGGQWQDAAEFLTQSPPTIWFADGSSLDGNEFVAIGHSIDPFDRSRIAVVDWSGIDIRQESQGPQRNTATVQGRLLRHLSQRQFDIVFDDDGKGEAADVIAASLVTDFTGCRRIDVEFYHCKYSGAATPGARVGDLYEVCGQAQRSVQWLNSRLKGIDLFSHMLRRETRRTEVGGMSRFQVGTQDKALELREASRICPISLRVFIVQPGLSRGAASHDHLTLLGVTQCYLLETYQVELSVIASP